MATEHIFSTLERTLRESRQARRALDRRLAEIEEEMNELRRQAAELDSIIAHTEQALLRLFNGSQSKTQSETKQQTEQQEIETVVAEEQARTGELPKPVVRRPPPPINLDIKPTSLRFRDLKMPQAASIVLREAAGPLHVNEIYNRLLDGGFQFGGSNHLISLAVSLSRSNRFRKVSPGTFDLVFRDADQVA